MNIEERTKKFWGDVLRLRLDSAQIALWFALLRQFQIAGFPTRCVVENDELCTLLSCNIKTLIAVRKRLIDNRLIGYEAGNAKRQPAYIIDEELIEAMSPAKEVVKEQPKVVVEIPRPKPKPRTKKEPSADPVLFPVEKPKPRQRKVEPEQPTLEDVVRVCMEKGMNEEEAKKFYYYYDAQGWVTTGGQKIKRIDSMVNRWLNNQKAKSNGSDNTNSAKRKERNEELARDILSHYM